MGKNKSRLVSLVFLVIIIILIVILCVDLFPLLTRVVKDKGDESHLVSYMQAYGAKGVPIIIGLQALQVIIAVFPAAAIQVLAGLCYGVWWGAVLCIIGYVLGNMLVFIALRQFKKTLGPYLPGHHRAKTPRHSKLFNVQHIQEMNNPEYAVVLLYLIPGIPNGILPYIFADTKITSLQYFFSVLAASAPSILLCTFLGESLAKRNFLLAGILLAVVVVLLVVLFVFKNKITQWVDAFTAKHKVKRGEA